MEPKSFRLHTTKGANNHIKQGDTVFFARNPIGIACNQLPAMLTNTVQGLLEKRASNINVFINVKKNNRLRLISIVLRLRTETGRRKISPKKSLRSSTPLADDHGPHHRRDQQRQRGQRRERAGAPKNIAIPVLVNVSETTAIIVRAASYSPVLPQRGSPWKGRWHPHPSDRRQPGDRVPSPEIDFGGFGNYRHHSKSNPNLIASPSSKGFGPAVTTPFP